MKTTENQTIIEKSDIISALQDILQHDHGIELSESELNIILDELQYLIEFYLKMPETTKNQPLPIDSIKIIPFGFGSSLSLESYLDSGGTRILNGATITTPPRTRVKAKYSNYFKRRIVNGLKA